jgi:uncharacterized membrane protein HdeD (DUF308 family)
MRRIRASSFLFSSARVLKKEAIDLFVILERNWWMLLSRGVLAFIFGLFCFAYPGVTLTIMTITFGIYALTDGILAVASAISRGPGQPRWWSTLAEGIVGIIFGGLSLITRDMTGLGLLYLIAAWAILTGILKVAAAVQLRRQIIGEWLLLFGGASSMLCGLLLLLMPGAGVLAVVFWIGAYALTLGMIFVVFALRLKRWIAPI